MTDCGNASELVAAWIERPGQMVEPRCAVAATPATAAAAGFAVPVVSYSPVGGTGAAALSTSRSKTTPAIAGEHAALRTAFVYVAACTAPETPSSGVPGG